VLGEALPEPGRDVAGWLLEDLREHLPEARITVLAMEDEAGRADALLRRGLEVAVGPSSPRAWGGQRLHHYSATLAIGPEALRHFGPMLKETQSLAVGGYVPTGGSDADRPGLRWADVVVVPSDGHAVEAVARAGPIPVVVIGRRGHGRGVIDLLAHLGLTAGSVSR
jgi:hypothetical protein